MVEDNTVYYTFLTNLDFEHAKDYLKIYKKRWNIETRFRMFKDLKIKTKSRTLKVRLFLFILRAIIHNFWIWMKHKNEIPYNLNYNLKEFIISINDFANLYCKPSFDYGGNTRLCISNAYSEILLNFNLKVFIVVMS
ncbi:transposase [Methanotorris formicicus]|uniref:transposase n=1 Tax=Methanotorris formicicus TaxID=213185 RepID=UPI001FDF1891|nr:transposase [Methanotorris formicicus]